MKRFTLITIGFLALLGCAKNSGVIPYGENTFMVSRQAATGFSGMGNLKSEALEEASAHCANSGKQVKVLKEVDAEPPYILGNYPRTEIHFQCI
ncbi:hypothetical protein MHM95_06795 [Pseudoalteromonas sp. CnMc7-15]|uniref:hypothetical protein n=1 Tax=unclassified Pseudoalteromonas TaxID=194690 RepID=UPI001EF579E3|nr:hypothetical protein [Pseudoalteromonas sp. CnMc7-15]MCG7565992.1 hypothetical protein [Pseudoalteromonas sp. CnMc7-15]